MKFPIEKLHLKEAPVGSRCEIHEWPSKGLGARLQLAVRARHGMGGINICTPCIERAKKDADASKV